MRTSAARFIKTYILFTLMIAMLTARASGQQPTVARQWNETLLECIRNDFARPTVHARNLLHVSIAMWDSWAAYDRDAANYLFDEKATSSTLQAARKKTMSFAVYRILKARFADSPGRVVSLPIIEAQMTALGYDPTYEGTVGGHAAAVGNRIAHRVLSYGAADGANEAGGYAIANGYTSVNEPLVVAEANIIGLNDPNRWQPLSLEFIVDQSGFPVPLTRQLFLTPHWGALPPFGMTAADLAPGKPGVYFDPGTPPQLGGAGNDEYLDMFTDLVLKQAKMSPDFAETIDIGPGAWGNNPLGTNDGTGHAVNPVTGLPYAPNVVKLGDWSRCIAEFWADGPHSETPPGHWNTLANYVTDNLAELRIGGEGPVLDPLEWDVKLYLALNGAVYDAAVAAWGVKNHYDFVRPISAIRLMASLGQRTDAGGPAYHPQGLPLVPGLIEVITTGTAQMGERHAALAEHVGEIAVLSWPGEPLDGMDSYSGVVWQLGTAWVPYQRETFVTPPFAGYVSGHSTFSRSAAEVLTEMTGSEYFPGGLGTFDCDFGEFLVFEDGPSTNVQLQWATYYDAADEAGISRLWGGIHPRADDFPGRIMGSKIGKAAWARAQEYFDGSAASAAQRRMLLDYLLGRVTLTTLQLVALDLNEDGRVDVGDLVWLNE